MTSPSAEATRQDGSIGPAPVPCGPEAMAERASHPLRMAVGIASAGRPSILRETVDYLTALPNQAERLIVCVPAIDDAAGLADRCDVEVIVGSRGLTSQRNRIIQAAAFDIDVLIFLDDDFIPAATFLPRMAAVFAANPNVAIATGEVLADGVLDGGLSMSKALQILDTAGEATERVTEVYNAYGCNMAVRLSPVLEHALAFDEQLPLYGWLEDVDFSRSIARYGRSVHVEGARGVHLGVRSGRQPGRRLGYSQVANPVYLIRKGTMSRGRAVVQIGRNILANTRGLLFNDRLIDRWGRLNGNFLALSDLVVGRTSPSRILEFGNPSPREMPSPSIATKRR
ncbi:GT2 family glycosyltransferase [Rhizobium sp. BK226]|uniref:glycosyltransferase family 2 protein n=1 Tax=Rhizobium TaxID=379 RepID=UPI0003F79EAC|nr:MULTISPECIES: glycosyltransferase [Rhizobium]MBB3296352.1 GT2 family glycosyltransferase [Rhizobium sp. BK112]MBB3365567.1 GT2 family glycosyltransferase [Rhizobium sp. BK077]MBB3740545.1 GT2 family glycosyltransferase [Rhizobium sp. BK591]MBB4111749.1 GT2 family glycosyltransferase [Rhizobium sp. BK226]MBB4176245.1 GT2 family glycosyltransferase [Rhizobium sp. BK109]